MSSDMQLRVILDAKDKITSPLKNTSNAAKELAAVMKSAKQEIKALQATQADISSFQKLSAAQGNHSKKLEELKQKLHSAGITSKNMASAERELAASLYKANEQMAQQKAKLQKINELQAKSAAISARHDKNIQRGAMISGAGYAGLTAARATANALTTPVKAAADFEDAMLGVARQVEGSRDASGKLTQTYYDMGESILSMSKRIPMAATEIAALVEAGARMGIQGKENLLTFAETTAVTATAFDLPVEEVGDNMGKIAGLYKIPIKDIRTLGDTINFLDDNSLSKGGDIIEVMQRLGGVATSAGMSFKDAAALGSTFLSLGARAEVAGTAGNAMIRELSIANMQPKKFQAGMEMIGMSSAQVQKDMSKDATGTILKVLEAIKKLDKEKQLTAATQLFGKEYGDDAVKLANNLEEYRRQLALVNDEKAKGSMQREADAKNEAMSQQYIMTQNRLFDSMKRAGDALRPTLIDLMNTANGWLQAISGFIQKHPALTAGIMKAAMGFTLIVGALSGVLIAVGSIIGPFSMLTFGIAKIGLHAPAALTALKTLGGGILNFGHFFMAAGKIILMSPIGIAIGLLIAAGYLLWKNWDGVIGGLKAIWENLGGSVGAVITTITTALVNFSPLGLVYQGFQLLMSYLGIEMPATLYEAGAKLISSLINGIKSNLPSLGGVMDWVKEKTGFGGVVNAGKQITAGVAMGTMAAMPLTAGVPLGGQGMLKSPAAVAAQPAAAPIAITVNPSAGMDEKLLAKEVQKQMAAAQQRDAAAKRSKLSDRE